MLVFRRLLLAGFVCLLVLWIAGMLFSWGWVIASRGWSLGGVIAVIGVMIIAGSRPASIPVRNTDRLLLQKHLTTGVLPWHQAMLIANKALIFPVLLVIYICLLLIDQTGMFGLSYHPLLFLLDRGLILFLTIVSGGATICGDKHDELYTAEKYSLVAAWKFFALAILCAVGAGYLIRGQVDDLGRLGIVCANIGGVMIFLIAMLWMKEHMHHESSQSSRIDF